MRLEEIQKYSAVKSGTNFIGEGKMVTIRSNTILMVCLSLLIFVEAYNVKHRLIESVRCKFKECDHFENFNKRIFQRGGSGSISHTCSIVLALSVFSLDPMPSGAVDVTSVIRQLETRQSSQLRELRDLKDLQDMRLDQCADRGVFWEQCFMFGEGKMPNSSRGKRAVMSNGDSWKNSLDYQFLSPIGASEPASDKERMPPTW